MATRGINKVILVGNLGQDPDVKQMQNGNYVANFSLATSESWVDRNTNETRQKTEWHRVVIFGKLAEIAKNYLRKGAQVYVEGQLQTRKWQDQSGQDKYTTEVVLQGFNGVMQMLGGKNDANMDNMPIQSTQAQMSPSKSTSQQSQKPQENSKPPEFNNDVNFDDDIPF